MIKIISFLLTNVILLNFQGFHFDLDKLSAHPDLKIANNIAMALTSPVYATIMGNASISSGIHYWEVLIEQFESHNETAVIGWFVCILSTQPKLRSNSIIV